MAQSSTTQQSRTVNEGVLRVVGRGRFIEFTLDDQLPLSTVEGALREYLEHVGSRFEEGRVTLNLGNRLVDSAQVERLKQVLERHKLTLAGLSCGADALLEVLARNEPRTYGVALPGRPDGAEAPVGRARPAAPPRVEVKREQVEVEGQETLLVRGTCRSGTTIHNAGNVVVVGDVNPGAEITATKDIVVFGKLAGMAHAGFDGDEDAVIIALRFQALQLRIGPHIMMDGPARNRARVVGAPERASVSGGAIVVQPFVARSVWRQEE